MYPDCQVTPSGCWFAHFLIEGASNPSLVMSPGFTRLLLSWVSQLSLDLFSHRAGSLFRSKNPPLGFSPNMRNYSVATFQLFQYLLSLHHTSPLVTFPPCHIPFRLHRLWCGMKGVSSIPSNTVAINLLEILHNNPASLWEIHETMSGIFSLGLIWYQFIAIYNAFLDLSSCKGMISIR